MSKRRNRAISWIVLMVFSLVIFCSSAFIIIHTDHECTGENCSICTELAKCHKTLHFLGTGDAGIWCLTLMLCIAYVFCKLVTESHSAHTTLISLKVELLN